MATAKERRVAVHERKAPPLWVEEIDRFLDWPVRRVGLAPWPRLFRSLFWSGDRWYPDIDVIQRNGTTVVRADLPGMKRQDIDVSVEEGRLLIRAHRREEQEVADRDYYYSERAFGEFVRAISLPAGADVAKIEATYRDGVLEVTFPTPGEKKGANGVKVPVKE